MSTHKRIDVICLVTTLLAIILCAVFVNGEALGIQQAARVMGYETRLFDTTQVHTIDITMDDWDNFIETCENEEYAVCSVVIDGETYSNVGIRAKGNTSLSNVSSMGSDRYSFKIEFDQYDSTTSYHGLDKLSLNNLIQDATMMKDYLAYRLMGEFGAAAPLCSYAYITVNGEDWGLYLAVEGVEDGFLQRNYGSDHGELYKPDSLSFGGGGPGHGQDFNMDNFLEANRDKFPVKNNEQQREPLPAGRESMTTTPGTGETRVPEGITPSDIPGGFTPPDMADGSDRNPPAPDMPEIGGPGNSAPNMGGGMGGEDVKLQYIDDDPDSYSNIFAQAKTDISQADQARLIESLKNLTQGNDIERVVDINQVLRYFVVHNFLVNADSYTGSMIHNYYLYEEDGKLSMIPWDYNLAYGTFQSRDAGSAVNDPIDTPLSITGSGDRPMADWIFGSEEYIQLYHQYFVQFLETTDFGAMIDKTAALIAPYVEKDPTKFYTTEEFKAGTAAIREFCMLRAESVLGQLNGTIPATQSGQSSGSGALVDASHITLSDMGSMNMGGGRGSRPDARQQQPQSYAGEAPADRVWQQPELSDSQTPEDGKNTFPAPAGINGTAHVSQNTPDLSLLAVSAAVLLLGLILVKLYRR